MNVSIVFFLLLLVSCTPVSELLKYENTDQFFLERTLNRLNINELYTSLTPQDKIILRSVETPEKNDQPILSLIEDRLIEKLIKDGYQVYERDTEVVQRLFNERDSKVYMHGSGKNERMAMRVSNLTSATKIITYRVEEYGIKFRPHLENRDLKIREGFLKVYLKVVDARTSELISADHAQVYYFDDVANSHSEDYKHFKYKSYTHLYPVLNPSDSLRTMEPVEPEKISPLEELKLFTEPQIVFRGGGALGLGVRYGVSDAYKRFTGQLYYSISVVDNYTLSVNYDQIFDVPDLPFMENLKLVTRLGPSWSKIKDAEGLGLQLGTGFEFTFSALQFHIGWNHNIPFRKADNLWTNDLVLSVQFFK